MPIAKAISDKGTMLYYSATGLATSFTKLIGITAAPAAGGAPSKIEITELDWVKKGYIGDRPDTPDMEFSFNYTEANFDLVETKCNGSDAFFLLIYADGSGQKITGQGYTWVDAVALGSAVAGKLAIVASLIEHQTAVQVTALKTV